MSFSTNIIPFGTPAYDEMVRLRNEILVQPLGISFTTKDFAFEYQQFHFACYDPNMHLVGCMVLVPLTESEIKMRQVAVARNFQNQGIGKLMVAESEQIRLRECRRTNDSGLPCSWSD